MLAVCGMVLLGVAAPWYWGVHQRTPAVIASGTLLIRMGILLEPGRVFNVVVISSLRATGDARFPVMAGFVCMWGIWVPLAWLLGLKLGLGLVGIWISLICDEWTRGMIMYWRWRGWKWLPAAERSRAVAGEKALAEAQSAAPQEG
ncbi:MAG: hypothetical protein U1F98_14165 [Verrucomicrobiota bacterium]